ncbi:hypothetical protein DFH09DRAFT_1306022 [Mycena vulgaris]|nr:hypothetical protein DFH09DRAFT_1306022 [Mycena vulgaris]
MSDKASKSTLPASILPTNADASGAVQWRPRRVSRCYIILATFFAALALFAVGQPVFVLLQWMEQTKFCDYPPSKMFVETHQLDGVQPRPSNVVWPLIELHDRFDIAASVWQETSGMDIPLLEEHEVPSMCPDAPKKTRYNMDGVERLKDHPHVVTRTNLRIVRESRLYNRTAFLEMHEMLRRSSCGQLQDRGHPMLSRCRRWYLRNANYETLVQLAVPDSKAEGGFREESAYAPYMDVLASAVGPKDVIPVPIDREDCGLDAPNPANRALSDHMNITWHLSYSSVSPLIFALGEMKLTELVRSCYTDSEYLLPPVTPPRTSADTSLFEHCNSALKMTGLIMQLILNHRAKVFAGRYKAAVPIVAALRTLRHAAAVRWLVGSAQVMSSVSYAALGWDVLFVWICWQAW